MRILFFPRNCVAGHKLNMYLNLLEYEISPIDKAKVQWYLQQIETGQNFEISEAKDCDLVFHWDYRNEDAKVSEQVHRLGLPILNGKIENVKKDFVDKCFLRAFGYSLFVNPETFKGHAVRKSTRQATHDAHIIICPRKRDPKIETPLHGQINHEWTYQRLIDNSFLIRSQKWYRDYRTPFANGGIPLVWYKDKNTANRFEPLYGKKHPLHHTLDMKVSVEYNVDKVFSKDEQQRIKKFCEYFGADFCDLDIMRDKNDKLYIVDVNNIAAGPLFRKLSDYDRNKSMWIVANEVKKMIDKKLEK
jgi:hypothetical protein